MEGGKWIIGGIAVFAVLALMANSRGCQMPQSVVTEVTIDPPEHGRQKITIEKTFVTQQPAAQQVQQPMRTGSGLTDYTKRFLEKRQQCKLLSTRHQTHVWKDWRIKIRLVNPSDHVVVYHLNGVDTEAVEANDQNCLKYVWVITLPTAEGPGHQHFYYWECSDLHQFMIAWITPNDIEYDTYEMPDNW